MATARLSPAATLLRNSRLFSVPSPLSPPASLASQTATQPHPTHAAIETPHSSWERGDWGFKRPLPLKSTTKTGTTTIRVQNGIDTIEHITDFESAADHVLTLQKLTELNLSIRFIKKGGREETTSVFESRVDNTIPSASWNHRRWRYDGPWLAGQTGLEFDALVKKVRGRRAEFDKLVRARLQTERSTSRRQAATDAGQQVARREAVTVTDEDFAQHMHYLRQTPSAFGPLIAEFLDLPEGPSSTSMASNTAFTYGRKTLASEAWESIGPPKTHPSAGISYYRSGAHVSNHPVFGPQQHNPPVFARELRPSIRRKSGDLGIAGFVAAPSSGTSNLLAPVPGKPWKPTPGGGKLVVRPTMAAVDSDGRLLLGAERAQPDSRKVYGLIREESLARPEVTRGRLSQMPSLDERGTRETKGLHNILERAMRLNEDSDHI